MNTRLSPSTVDLEDRFGTRIAARLTAGNQELPHDIGERLRSARTQAVARRKVVQMRTATAVVGNGGAVSLGGGWWTRIGSVVPLVALVAGLVAISVLQDDNRASELAEVDAALLTGDLPPAAYTDPGFAQFLKSDDSVVH
ncbi:DUF3619 family protein [Variovorax sp. J22R133]|uniref:DUF3619 family protein n=1 Tax=Variovorax brevis TaxID=3053503 RepID=UPI0025767E2C|nr:DUF3619 family protein [Variovorax sp. J22R133]MDM0112414.1 DUF3619 family protein [Variovorax sp. J22R133]